MVLLMSGESSSKGNVTRPLRKEELDLLYRILEGTHLAASAELKVRDLSDGGMGSIEFFPESLEPRRPEGVVEADYMDSDGVPVSIAVNIDQYGKLFELDIWKVNFGPLRTYPTPKTIRNIRAIDDQSLA